MCVKHAHNSELCVCVCVFYTVSELTHVVEMLPEGLHPLLRALGCVCGHGVRPLLSTLVCVDADVLCVVC